jgi:hypothetical protein
MVILRESEVNLKEILERFEYLGNFRFNEIELRYPDIGKEWTLEQKINIHLEDWEIIIPELEKKYQEDYDLILASAYIIDRLDRTAQVNNDFYKLK